MAEHALITGGAGFIGAHLARRLLDEGVRVTLVDDFSRGRQDEMLDQLALRATLVRHNLTEPIPEGVLPKDVDTVYHLAAVVGVQRTADSPGRVLRTNVLAASNVFDWCDEARPGTVFLSSTSEFADGAAQSGLASFPTPEDVPFLLARPHSTRASYALSKAVAESMLMYRAGQTRVRIGRYFNVYGPRMGHSHVIPQFIGRILAGEDPFRVYGSEQTRAFCHVDDAVTATVALSRLPGDEPVLANIGDDSREIRIADLARLLLELAGVSPRLEILDSPSGSPERRLPDLSTLHTVLGARETVPLEKGLRQMLDWYGAESW
ncbi:NAD-dependent epimerase/dehydratase family protein [Streptomyces sp. NPDC054794]